MQTSVIYVFCQTNLTLSSYFVLLHFSFQTISLFFFFFLADSHLGIGKVGKWSFRDAQTRWLEWMRSYRHSFFFISDPDGHFPLMGPRIWELILLKGCPSQHVSCSEVFATERENDCVAEHHRFLAGYNYVHIGLSEQTQDEHIIWVHERLLKMKSRAELTD